VAAAVGVAFAGGSSFSPPTPPLLKGARAAGGWNSEGCPPHPGEIAFSHIPEARSQDVESRLSHEFLPERPNNNWFFRFKNKALNSPRHAKMTL